MKEDSKFLAGSGLIIAILIGFTWFIAWTTNYNPTVTSTVVTAMVAIIIGYLAAYMGARATLRAVQRAHEYNLELQSQNQSEQIRGVVQAIYTELKSLWDIYKAEFEEEWEKHTSGDAFWSFYPITQNYFTIFDNNSALIGLIPNDQLRASIVKAYLHAKGLVDSHLYNNRLLDDREALRRHYMNVANPDLMPDVIDAVNELKSYGDTLKSSYFVARESVFETLRLIEDSGMLVVTRHVTPVG